jgi:large subunit ribosomal protein L24
MKIRKGDTVLIIAGRDKGKKGKVRHVLPKERHVIVDGLNIVKRHMRPHGAARQAGIVEREASIHVSDVMLVCNKCNKPTRVGFRFLEDEKKVRICRSCHEVID